MAKIRKIYDQTIKPDGSKTTIYPITSTRAVYTPEGETLDSYLEDGYFHGADLRGYKTVSNVTDLPTTENQFGWLIGEDLYVWVGTGGDTLGGLYQNCGHFRTPYVPDDEDLAADLNNELKLKDRTVEDGGMGYVILRKNKTFAEQLTKENTIYEIRYDFDLDNASVTVPSNCVLKFNGGSISNGTVVLDNTEIAGEPILNVVLSGTCKNDGIYCEWFGIKSGESNMAGNNVAFTNYVIPSLYALSNLTSTTANRGAGSTLRLGVNTDCYFSTPLVFDFPCNLDFQGKLHYGGSYNSTAITVGGGTIGFRFKKINIAWLDSQNISFYDAGSTIVDYVGLSFVDVSNCNINIAQVKNFAYCVRLKSYASGAANNTITINTIQGVFYVGLHLVAENTGWTNENLFINGNIHPSSSNPYKLDHRCISVLLDGSNASYTLNTNYFEKLNLEGSATAIKCIKANNNIFDFIRAGSTEKVLDCAIDCNNNFVSVSSYPETTLDYSLYGRNNRIIVSNSKYCSLGDFAVEKKLKAGDNTSCFGINLLEANRSGRIAFYSAVEGEIGRGFVVEINSSNNILNLVANTTNSSFSFNIAILDQNNFPVEIEDKESYIESNIGSWSYNSTNKIISGTVGTWAQTVKFKSSVSRALIYALNCDFEDAITVDGFGLCISNPIVRKNEITIKVIENMSGLWFSLLNSSYGISNYVLELNADIDMTNKTESVTLNRGSIIHCNGGKIINGTIALNGIKVFPDFNSLVDGNDTLTYTGMPAAGTLYWQNGKPTWSNGTNWVDASGTAV